MPAALSGPELILSLSTNGPGGEIVLSVFRSMNEALKRWGASTRCSPIFPFGGSRWPPSNKPYEVWFVGSVFPGELADMPAFLSLGAYSLVLPTNTSAQATDVRKFLAKHPAAPWEHWKVTKSGVVSDIQYAACLRGEHRMDPERGPIALSAGLASMAEEYRTLVAATITKARNYWPEAADEVADFDDGFRKSLESRRFKDVVKSQWLVNVNAALSRFSSQTFAGISPITGTECHYWTHSLLGVGLGTQALVNIRRQVQRAFDKVNFRVRLQALKNAPPNAVRLERLRHTDRFFQTHHLPADVDIASKPQLTPIVFFSGRDGFRSTPHTLSVPLEVLSASNTAGWTLRTVTHELSHLFVDSILRTLLPSVEDLDGAKRILQLLDATPPASLFENAQAYLSFALLQMGWEWEKARRKEIDITPERFIEVIESVYPEVSEVLTHIFDFQYFYHRDPAVYIPAIWASWDVIPNILSRVPDYLVRTVCAVLSLNLTAADPVESSFEVVLQELERLQASLGNANIVDSALDLLRNGREGLRKEIVRNANLVALANAFLYSPQLAQEIGGIPPRARTAAKDFPKKRFSAGQRVANPLNFIYNLGDGVKLTNDPDRQVSAWAMAQLAFADMSDGTE